MIEVEYLSKSPSGRDGTVFGCRTNVQQLYGL